MTEKTSLVRDIENPKYEDAFGKHIADGTRNTLDIPSIYDFNPERHRLLENNARVSPADVSSQFTDSASSYDLTPDAGNSLTVYSAERPRYIVGYEAAASTAGMLTESLGSGDTYTVGLRDFQDPENGAFFEINGETGNRVVLKDQDTIIKESAFSFPSGVDPTEPIRYEIQFNAYNVGRYQFKISYTDDTNDIDDKQENEIVAELVVDDDFAISDWNHHIFHTLNATNAGKGVKTGSMGYIVLGNVEETNRVKGASFRELSYGGSGDFEPLAALRVDPTKGTVYSQLQNVSVFPDGGGGRLIIQVFDDDDTDATGFETPPEMTSKNSVIQATTNVSEVVDEAGNTVTTTTDPGGYQIGFSTFESAGQGSSTRTQPSQTVENKRPIYDDNVAVVLYQADSATAREVNVNYFVEQDF